MRQMIETPYLFVYGSLKRSFQHPMHSYIEKWARYMDVGSLQGRLYRIDWYPGAVDSGEVGDRVHGEIYQMVDPVPLLDRLDAFEAYDPRSAEACEYLRLVRPVVSTNRGVLPCYVYLYHFPLGAADRIETGVFEADASRIARQVRSVENG
jgi:gamma-glutamylcyclotransferase (GGCT)/AIG2-like uncharacterized protein YtfP